MIAHRHLRPGANSQETVMAGVNKAGLATEDYVDLTKGLKRMKPNITIEEIERIGNALNIATKLNPMERYETPTDLALAMFPDKPKHSARVF
jgi:hypothetical protein